MESFYSLLLIELRAYQGKNLKTRNPIKSKHLSLYRLVMCFAFDLETVVTFSELFIHVPNRSKPKMLYLSLACMKSYPHGIYIPMETLHSHVKSEISVQRMVKDYDEHGCCQKTEEVWRGV